MKNRLDSSGLVKLCSIIIRAIAKSGSDTLAAANKYTNRQFNEPTVDLIRQWREYWRIDRGLYGDYNNETKFFEAGDCKNITPAEARTILSDPGSGAHPGTKIHLGSVSRALRIHAYYGGLSFDGDCLVGYASNLEYLLITTLRATIHPTSVFNSLTHAFIGCVKLRRVDGLVCVNVAKSPFNSTTFKDCAALEYINIYGLSHDVSFADSPLLSAESLAYLVANAANTAVITVTVHPDVYAKLADKTNAEWHKILTDAAARDISFATTA